MATEGKVTIADMPDLVTTLKQIGSCIKNATTNVEAEKAMGMAEGAVLVLGIIEPSVADEANTIIRKEAKL